MKTPNSPPASGRSARAPATIAEQPELDLAVITIDDREPMRRGHRFGGDSFEGLHPMAIHNATGRFRLLVVHGRRYRYVDRYETWVQYRSRPVLARVDMRPLATRSDRARNRRRRLGEAAIPAACHLSWHTPASRRRAAKLRHS